MTAPTPPRGGRAASLGVPALVVMMVLPLPKALLDLLLALNLASSLVILLTALTAQRALDFSVFPALLLVTTLMRLALTSARPGSSSSRATPARSSRPSVTSSWAAAWSSAS